MDKLLQPDAGLMIWTFITFGFLVVVLKLAAWKPILKGLNAREGKIRSDLDRAENAQKEAEALRLKFESQLSAAQKTIQDMVNQARADGERARAQMLTQAREESERILEKGRKDLAGETDRLKGELRSEVASLSIDIAEKILKKSVDAKAQQQIIEESLNTINGVRS